MELRLSSGSPSFLEIFPGWQEKRWRFNKERFDYFKSTGFAYIHAEKERWEKRVEFEYAIKGFTKKQIHANIAARALQMPDFLNYVRCISKESRNIAVQDNEIKRKIGEKKFTKLPDKKRYSKLWKICAASYAVTSIILIVSYIMWVFRRDLADVVNVTSVITASVPLTLLFAWITFEIAKAAIRNERLYKINDLNGNSFRTKLE